MPVAPDLYALKRRLDRYFFANKSAEMAVLKSFLAANFSQFDRIAVVGGLARDFAREGRSGFRSDVDLVIDASAAQVEELAQRLGARSNRFGGYGFSGGLWKIDFWALENTWTARHAGVSVEKLDDVIRCTFFNWDAIAYDFRARRVICESNYLSAVKEKVLDINVQHSPSLEGNLLRTIRRLVLWRLDPGPTLQAFIKDNLTETMFKEISRKERAKFTHSVTSVWHDAENARNALIAGFKKAPKSDLLDGNVDPYSLERVPRGRAARQKKPPSRHLYMRLPGI
jgi:hypothetical protein